MAMRLAISSFRRKFPNIKGASTELVHKWYKEGVGETTPKGRNQEATTGSDKRTFVIVDSRPDEEYKISHISGCVRIDFTIEDDANLIHLIDSAIKEDERHLPKTVVMYCSLGYRSCILADKLINALKTKGAGTSSLDNIEIYNMEGGLFKWALEGSPLVDIKGKQTKFVHPYSPIFGQLLHRSMRRYKDDDDD